MKVAVLVGGAEGGWRERRRAVAMVEAAGHDVVSIACNEAGIDHPDPLDHWATLHPDHFVVSPYNWLRRREEAGGNMDFVAWSMSRRHDHTDRCARTRGWTGGSSGLHMFDVALHGLELPLAICCGVPLDGSHNRYRDKPWTVAKNFRVDWKRLPDASKARMRSMSGWTRELLGEPTMEWLAG